VRWHPSVAYTPANMRLPSRIGRGCLPRTLRRDLLPFASKAGHSLAHRAGPSSPLRRSREPCRPESIPRSQDRVLGGNVDSLASEARCCSVPLFHFLRTRPGTGSTGRCGLSCAIETRHIDGDVSGLPALRGGITVTLSYRDLLAGCRARNSRRSPRFGSLARIEVRDNVGSTSLAGGAVLLVAADLDDDCVSLGLRFTSTRAFTRVTLLSLTSPSTTVQANPPFTLHQQMRHSRWSLAHLSCWTLELST